MKIDHIAVFVKNIEAIKEFYIKYFDAKANTKYYNKTTGLETYFLNFDDGSRLEIMHRPDIAVASIKAIRETGYAHLAFNVCSRENVDDLTATLKADGYTVSGEPRITGDGYYESCIFDPEGNQVEIVSQ